MKLSIVGLGNLGTAIAHILSANGHNIIAWDYNALVVGEINQRHSNEQYLKNTALSHQVVATTDFSKLLVDSTALIIALPSRYAIDLLCDQHKNFNESLPIINMSKGINGHSNETLYQTIVRLFPKNPTAVLSGPTIANEFSRKMPTAIVAASKHKELLSLLSNIFTNSYFSVIHSYDEVGVELGGILKNIYALGMGLADGYQFTGKNFQGAFLSLSLCEMNLLVTTMKGNPMTLLGLAGVGDLITTALSEHSHNRSAGMLLAQGASLADIEQKMGVFPEGYHSLCLALQWGERYKCVLPLAQLIYDTIAQQSSASEFSMNLRHLMASYSG